MQEKMINANATLLQMYQLYLREIKPLQHKNWKYQVMKYHNISIADRKSHNYAVQLLVKQVQLDYSVELAKLAQLIINERISIRKMATITIDVSVYKLLNKQKI